MTRSEVVVGVTMVVFILSLSPEYAAASPALPFN